ncbi:MAG: hypothetical protein ABL904_19055 [Hyphomicrobiaceae bacterium]
MKTHYAEENDDVISSTDTADEHCWREHQISKRHLLGDIAITAGLIVALSISGLFWETSAPSPTDRSTSAQNLPPAFALRSHSDRARMVSADDDH